MVNKQYKTWRFNVRKKITALLLVLMMCLSVATGCSLIETDDRLYYEATVATVSYIDGTTENINKRELLLAYSSYGYNYVQNYNMTYNEAIKTTLDSVVDQHLTVKAVEMYYKQAKEDMFNENETSYLWTLTYDSLYSSILEYYYDIVGYKETESDSQEETSGVVYNKYNSTSYLKEVKVLDKDGNVVLDKGGKEVTKLVIKLKTPASTTRADSSHLLMKGEQAYDLEKDVFKDELYNTLYNVFGTNEKDASVQAWRSAIRDYVSTIKKNYTYMTFADDEQWIKFDINRVYNILKNNYIVEKYTEIFNYANHEGNDNSSISVTDILNRYTDKVKTDYATYGYNSNTSTFQSDMLSKVGEMEYIVPGNQKYFFVGSIKVEFDTTEKAKLEEINAYGNPLEKKEALDELYSKLGATERDSKGNKTSNELNASTLLKELRGKVDKIEYLTVEDLTEEQIAEAESEGLTLSEYVDGANVEISYQKAKIFRDYMFTYSDDDSVKNAEYNTVFGYDIATQEVFASENYNKDEIKEAIKNLYKDGAEIGKMTDLVKAEDGYYIFFFAGNIENLFGDNVDEDFELRESAIRKLESTRLNIFSEKTVFDKLFEELANDNFSVYRGLDIGRYATKIEMIENNMYN